MCVLVVEDEQLIRDTLVEFLEDHGLPVIAAADGDQAATLIENPPRRFSVLLTDFHMPGSRHGCDVGDHMKAHHPHVHVFVVTGRPDVLRSFCKSDLDYDVIHKPFQLPHLLDRIAHLVER